MRDSLEVSDAANTSGGRTPGWPIRFTQLTDTADLNVTARVPPPPRLGFAENRVVMDQCPPAKNCCVSTVFGSPVQRRPGTVDSVQLRPPSREPATTLVIPLPSIQVATTFAGSRGFTATCVSKSAPGIDAPLPQPFGKKSRPERRTGCAAAEPAHARTATAAANRAAHRICTTLLLRFAHGDASGARAPRPERLSASRRADPRGLLLRRVLQLHEGTARGARPPPPRHDAAPYQ